MTQTRKWKMEPAEVFAQGVVVPVMVIKDLDRAVPLARALVSNGENLKSRVWSLTKRYVPAGLANDHANGRHVGQPQ